MTAYVAQFAAWIRTALVPWVKANPWEAIALFWVYAQLLDKLANLLPISRKRLRGLEDRVTHLEQVLAQRNSSPDPDDDDDDDEPELPELTLEEQLRNLLADPHKVAEFRAAMSGNQIQEPPRRTWHEHLSDDET